MRRIKWLLGGVLLGFVAAHFVNASPEGRRFFERISQGAREFNEAVQEGYREGYRRGSEDASNVA